jgi:hypothetical protein
MRKFLIAIPLMFMCCLSQAQTHGAEEIIEKINIATSQMESMECSFVQTKHIALLSDKMVSKGKMYYSQPDKLRWEYVTPYTYTFILNENQVLLKNSNRSDVIDVEKNKMFKEIARLMMNSIMGKSLYSIGRVQTPTLVMIIERYLQNKEFKAVPFWQVALATTDEVKEALSKVRIINIDPRSSTVHWRFTEPSGKQIVLEIVNEVMHFYDNPLGVLTNSPGIEWHWTNLSNYINLQPGNAPEHNFGPIEMKSLGHGSGMLGLPGDFTPPSRFVRATFFQLTAPQQPNAQQSVFQAFHILNNFDIPTGTELPWGEASADMPSATQFTVASDTHNRMIYYRTMYNSNIRCIDLKKIDFAKVKYHSRALDEIKNQPVEMITIR